MAEHVTIGLIWLRIAAVDVPSSVKSGVHSFERQYISFGYASLHSVHWGTTNVETLRNFVSP
jgi:hypothetical protein